MLKLTLFLFVTLICSSLSLYIPTPCPGRSLISTIANLVELAEGSDCGCQTCSCNNLSCNCGNLSCGCGNLSCKCGSCSSSPCSCGKKAPQFVDVILPPLAAELPCGLGYLPAGVPLAASAYGCLGSCDSCVPVTSACSCTALATPQCPELRAYAKPIIL